MYNEQTAFASSATPTCTCTVSLHRSLLWQPLYEQTHVKPQYSTTTVVVNNNNNASKPGPGGGGGTRSSLSNNLSELDTLLQDLSSAQFIAEVDRRHSGGELVRPPPADVTRRASEHRRRRFRESTLSLLSINVVTS